jgi:hypothetical protein
VKFDRKLYTRLPCGVWGLIDRLARRANVQRQRREREKARGRELALALQRIRAGREFGPMIKIERRAK